MNLGVADFSSWPVRKEAAEQLGVFPKEPLSQKGATEKQISGKLWSYDRSSQPIRIVRHSLPDDLSIANR
jgi:hypothetical protein